MDVRDATPEDGPAACEVLRRSIAELASPITGMTLQFLEDG
jgi:hypothetical protein